MKNNQYSLHSIVSVIVLVVVTTVMAIVLTYNYFNTKEKLTNQLYKKAEITTKRIKNSISPFVNSYSINEYERLIINEMQDKEIFAIKVEDYITGNLIGKKAFETIKIRDKNWNVIEKVKTNNHLSNCFLHQEALLFFEKKNIGKVSVYYTNKFLEDEVSTLIIRNSLVAGVISIFLILSLFFAINLFVLNPINKIIALLLAKDKNGLPIRFNINKGSKEITTLSITMNKMIKKVKESKQEIDKLNERFELTLDAVQDGIWDWNIQTDEIYFSKRWKVMLGYDDDELENSTEVFNSLLHPDDINKVQKALAKHFKYVAKFPYSIEIRLRCKDGSYKWILARGKAIVDDNGNPIRMLGYHTDITKEKENEAYQKQQENLIMEQSKLASMGEMIGNIAHQWRQPLSVISTSATGMKFKKELNILGDDELTKSFDVINENAQYLSKTIDDFRDFIKGDTKVIEFKLHDVINSFLNLVNSSIKKHQIKIHLDTNEDIQIKGFPNELVQCFMNVFNNAKDALLSNNINETERYIFISTKKEQNKIIIEFKDNAGGIPKDIVHKIFEPYFTTKHKSQGTGLGLHMTYNLITHMDGNISVLNEKYQYNNKEYYGAKFVIELNLSS